MMIYNVLLNNVNQQFEYSLSNICFTAVTNQEPKKIPQPKVGGSYLLILLVAG